MTTYELCVYYVRLLILQYIGQPKASATIFTTVAPIVMPQTSVQTITFDSAPASGTFVLSYDDVSSAAINWNDSVSTIQGKLRAITGLGSVTVSGSIAGLLLTITFIGVTAPALPLVLVSSTLNIDDPVITETDEIIPLAVQNGFNLIAPNIATGVQLDVLGLYAGVSRSGPGFFAQITLDDADYYTLIQMAIVQNNAGSSLYDIQSLLHRFFPDEVLVFDYQNMRLDYLISSAIGSQDLVQIFVTEDLLPKPMTVQVAVIIYAPVITTFFGFRTYQLPAYNVTPFNSYADYQTDWPWLSYSMAVVA